MPRIVRMLGRGEEKVQKEVFEMLEDILDVAEDNEEMQILISPHVSLILEMLPRSTVAYV